MSTKKLRVVQKLDLRRLFPDDLEYFCVSDDIDREVMKRKGKAYNEDLAFNSLYFVVTKDKRVTVIPDHLFDPWREKFGYGKDHILTTDAQRSIDWFIEDVHGVKTVK